MKKINHILIISVILFSGNNIKAQTNNNFFDFNHNNDYGVSMNFGHVCHKYNDYVQKNEAIGGIDIRILGIKIGWDEESYGGTGASSANIGSWKWKTYDNEIFYVGYDIPLYKGLYITPTIFYNYFNYAEGYTDGSNWHVSNYTGSIVNNVHVENNASGSGCYGGIEIGYKLGMGIKYEHFIGVHATITTNYITFGATLFLGYLFKI